MRLSTILKIRKVIERKAFHEVQYYEGKVVKNITQTIPQDRFNK